MKVIPAGKYKYLRLSICAILIVASVFYAFIFPHILYSQYEPQEGDIIFQSLSKMSDLARAIEGVSGSKYSHCGVVIKVNGKWYVKEALGDVHNTELFTWLKRGRGYRLDIYRFKNEYKKYTNQFIGSLNKYDYKAYDIHYKLNDDEIYCSELPYLAFKDITGQSLGKLIKLGALNWKPYKETIEKYEKGAVPLEREMITPKGLSEAEQLYHVQSMGI